MELRVLESGGIKAMADYLEQAMSGTYPKNLFEEHLEEVYTLKELGRLTLKEMGRLEDAAWAMACLQVVDRYFRSIILIEG
jgi:hypothetical protein